MSLAAVIVVLMLLVIFVWGLVTLLSNPVGQAIAMIIVVIGFLGTLKKFGLVDTD